MNKATILRCQSFDGNNGQLHTTNIRKRLLEPNQ